MIIDFQHHFIPRELAQGTRGDLASVQFDESGVPSMTVNSELYDLDEHIEMMDFAGIDAAFLSSPRGMCVEIELSRFINDKTRDAMRDYPGRFIGAAHVHPLGGPEAMRELARCSIELGFPGVVITSEMAGSFIDAPELEPFWSEVTRLGMFVFIHPALKLSFAQFLNAYDMARSVGREFSLMAATIRLINSGVLDRHPNLRIHMSHLGGGIASVLGRARKYQDKEFWGTAGHPLHGKLPKRDLDYYLNERIVFDTAGMCGAITSVQASLVEIPASRIVFETDYPQEIRSREAVRAFVSDMRSLGPLGEQILAANTGLLLNGWSGS
jgi:predicted TIM-barrel fold metal-dependent hydrolase